MEQWIGKPKITATLQPKVADRDDFLIRAIGPGPTDYTFPLSLTGTVLAVWQETDSQNAAVLLADAILSRVGTASVPPAQGFWFDSYNSGDTLRETISDIENSKIQQFIKNRTPGDIYGKLLGDEVWEDIEKIDKLFIDKFGSPFFSSLDEAFEYSQVLDDLNKSPHDNANYLYRVCILSGIIDHIAIAPIDKIHGEQSLQKFRRWLEQKVGAQEANRLTQVFQMVKKLRIQYPIHDHFETTTEGRKIRKEVQKANVFFDVTEQKAYDHNWGIVLYKFGAAIKSILEEVGKLA